MKPFLFFILIFPFFTIALKTLKGCKEVRREANEKSKWDCIVPVVPRTEISNSEMVSKWMSQVLAERHFFRFLRNTRDSFLVASQTFFLGITSNLIHKCEEIQLKFSAFAAGFVKRVKLTQLSWHIGLC